MKLFTIILILVLSCKSSQPGHPVYIKASDKFSNFPFPPDKEINLNYDIYTQCITHYFFATDTMKSQLSRIVSYDETNKEKETFYYWYESYVPATEVSFYDSLGRRSIRYYRIDEKSGRENLTKTTYEYDEKGKMIKSISHDFKRRIRKDVDKGLGRPGGCIVTEEDYEKYKSWELSSTWNYKYDETGKLIEKYAPVINSTQNRYTYKYDEKGRLIEERSLEDDRLIWIESYTYYEGGHEYILVWYEDGQRRKNWKGEVYPINTFRYKVDQFGNQTEKIVIEEGGRLVSRYKMYYDENNRVTRKEIFDGENKLLGFYVHKYQLKSKPVSKNFFVDNK